MKNAQQFLHMDGTRSNEPDPGWNESEARARGLIPTAPPSPIRMTPVRKTWVQIIHENDCAHARLTGGSGDED